MCQSLQGLRANSLVKFQRRCRAHICRESTWIKGGCEMTGAGVCPVAAGREVGGKNHSEKDLIMNASFQCVGKDIPCDILSFCNTVGKCPRYLEVMVRKSTSAGLIMPTSVNMCCRKEASLLYSIVGWGRGSAKVVKADIEVDIGVAARGVTAVSAQSRQSLAMT